MTGKRGEGWKKKLEAQRPLEETGEVTRVGVAGEAVLKSVPSVFRPALDDGIQGCRYW